MASSEENERVGMIPDLNPIENLWSELKRAVHKRDGLMHGMDRSIRTGSGGGGLGGSGGSGYWM